VGVLILSALITFNSSTVYADDEQQQRDSSQGVSDGFSSDILSLEKQSTLTFEQWLELQDSEEKGQATQAEDVPEPVEYTIEPGDSLIKIAKKYEIDWIRIWDKNTELEHPDKLTIDEVLVIPFVEEDLEKRILPESSVVEVEETYVAPRVQPDSLTNNTSPEPVAPRGTSVGNLYSAGYCTWYVKNRRPDLPNNLGNADTWTVRARAQGIPTGSKPRVGAVGQQGMHVVYIEAVHNDGTVTVSEMNWRGLYIKSTRRVNATSFNYIYQ
jgi:surface antigen